MGDLACRRRLPLKMHGLQPSDHDSQKAGRKKYQRPSDAGIGSMAANPLELLQLLLFTRGFVMCF